MKYDEFYLEQLSFTDLDEGEPVYMTDGMFLLPDGTLVEEGSPEYREFYRRHYE